MANVIFNSTYTTNDNIGGWTKSRIRGGFEPGTDSFVSANAVSVAMGNAGITVIQVPYGQTWPRG